jgi:hypothetical protein
MLRDGAMVSGSLSDPAIVGAPCTTLAARSSTAEWRGAGLGPAA